MTLRSWRTTEAPYLASGGAWCLRVPRRGYRKVAVELGGRCLVLGASQAWTAGSNGPAAYWDVARGTSAPACLGDAQNLRTCRRHDAASLWRGRQDYLRDSLVLESLSLDGKSRRAWPVHHLPTALKNRWRAGSGVIYSMASPSLGVDRPVHEGWGGPIGEGILGIHHPGAWP